MKTTFYLTMLMMMGVCAFAKAQTTPTKEKPKTNNNLPADGNLLDQQAQVLGNVFGDIGGLSEFQGIENYSDLLKGIDDPVLKKELKEQYHIYLSLIHI